MKRYAAYLDWENLWIPHIKASFPHLFRANRSVPLVQASPEEQALLHELPSLLSRKICAALGSAPRYSKAFAVWENLDYGRELAPRLRQAGINPIQSLGKVFHASGRKTIKEASDRALILKVVEDVMLRPHSKLDAIVLGTGDFGFVPLIEFLMEHTDLNVHVISFGSSLSSAMEQMVQSSFHQDHVLKIDDGDDFRAYLDRCSAAPRKVRYEQPLPAPQPVTASVVVPSLRRETFFENSNFVRLLVLGLHNTKMAYVSRGILEKQWIKKWGSGVDLEGSPSDLIAQAEREGFISFQAQVVDGRQIIAVQLNRGSERVARILRAGSKVASRTAHA
jgi:NYN domain